MEAEITLYIHHVGEFVQGLGCVDQAEERMERDGGLGSCGSKARASDSCSSGGERSRG
uniref:Uncharacterized protein n=1 Tax=Daucus carota subsp. sativus TaxID=79200 RepID=A0A162A1N2_DAUCS